LVCDPNVAALVDRHNAIAACVTHKHNFGPNSCDKLPVVRRKNEMLKRTL
jgi:hypothetical protein